LIVAYLVYRRNAEAISIKPIVNFDLDSISSTDKTGE